MASNPLLIARPRVTSGKPTLEVGELFSVIRLPHWLRKDSLTPVNSSFVTSGQASN